MPLPDLLDRDVLDALLAPIGMEAAGEAESVGAEYGFASALVRVPVSGAAEPVVVKAWSVDTHGTAEITFYEEWAPRLPVRVPRCFGAYAGEEWGVLVLEDLGDVRQGDAAQPIAPADAVSIARDLGAIHSATRDPASALPAAGVPRPSEWHVTRRAAHIDRHGSPVGDALRLIVERSERAEALAGEALAGSRGGLIHGDVHGDNVVFLADDTPVLLDWARPLWGPVADPLASLLLGTNPEGYDTAIEALRLATAVTDAEIHAAMLRRLVTATLGTAIWQPRTDRQRRLVDAGLAQADVAASWLGGVAPDLIAALAR